MTLLGLEKKTLITILSQGLNKSESIKGVLYPHVGIFIAEIPTEEIGNKS